VKTDIDVAINANIEPIAPRNGIGLILQNNRRFRHLMDARGLTPAGNIIFRRQVRKLLNTSTIKMPSERGVECDDKDVGRLNAGSCNLEQYSKRMETNTIRQALLQKRKGQVHCPISC
jgi:hypothetical protein